jgi:hypothetical protein
VCTAVAPIPKNVPFTLVINTLLPPSEESDGVRVRGEQRVYSSGAHCICRRMMRMCALEHVCVCVCARALARASVCVLVNMCEVLWFVGV